MNFLEFIISLIVSFLLLSAFIRFESNALNDFNNSLNTFKENIFLEQCAFVVDYFYNNVFSGKITSEFNCYNSEGFFDENISLQLINKEIIGFKNNEIKVNNHYN